MDSGNGIIIICQVLKFLNLMKYFLVPNPKNFSWMTVVTAMGQMFYSLSIAMGILDRKSVV